MIKQEFFPFGGSPYQLFGLQFKPSTYYLLIVLLISLIAAIIYFINQPTTKVSSNISKNKKDDGENPIPYFGIPKN